MIKFFRTLIVGALSLVCFQLTAQIQDTPYDNMPGVNKATKPQYNAEFPQWAQLLYQYPVSYYDVVENYEAASHVRGDELGTINRYYKLWIRAIEPFVNQDGSIEVPDPNEFYRTLQTNQIAASEISGANRMTSDWTFLGPKETFWLNESGMETTPAACPWQVNVYSFDVAASTPQTLFCGTETGFVNKSTDQGESWQLCATDYYFGGGVVAVRIHPEDANTIYASAGNQIHKSTDGGDTWLPMLPIGELFFANRLLIDPTNPDKIIAAANDGVHITLDGGESWEHPWSQETYDVEIKADDDTKIYALTKSGGDYAIASSDDGGLSFSSDANFPDDIELNSGGLLAVSADDPNMLLAVMLGADYTPVIYKADLGNSSWSLLATGQTNEFEMNNGQGYYDLAFEIDPNDADVFFAGTTTLFKTSNGGQNFTAIGGYYGNFAIHPDVQAMKILPDGDTWVATDGGFSYSTDHFSNTGNYDARNNGLIGSDMWGFDQGWNEDIVVGGRYHNGNTAIADFYQPKALRMGGAESPTGWVLQGKSRHVAFNDLGNGWILPQTAEGNPEGRFIYSKYPNMDEYGGRRSNMLIHPNYYGSIFVGEGEGFWQSTDMGVSWDLLHDFGSNVRFMQMSYSNPNVIYADIIGSGLHRSNDGGQSWESLPSLTQSPYASSYWEGKLFFAISPYDEDVVYACLNNGTWSSDIGEVFRSNDGGVTWEDWTGDLSEHTKCLVIQPTENGEDLVYLFTTARNGQDASVYMRGEDAANWELFDEGYPAGMGVNLALPFYRDSKLRVAGYGGVWESPMEETVFDPIINPWVEKSFYNCMTDTLYFDDHSIMNHDDATWHWEITPEPAYLSDADIRNPIVVLGAPGSYTVDFTVVKDGLTYNKVMEDMVTATTCPSVEDCSNPDSVPKDVWELFFVDSEEPGDPGLATMAFDDDPSTIWHTAWVNGSPDYPHQMEIDMDDEYEFSSFTYLPRQNGQNGRIKDYELYISSDTDDWGTAVSVGEFENSSAPQSIDFMDAPLGRYFKIVALSEVNGGPWASAAEFSLVGCYSSVVSVDETPSFDGVSAFPIPSSGMITVSLPTGKEFQYEVFSQSGQRVEEGAINGPADSFNLDLEPNAPGYYVLRLTNEFGTIFRIRLLKL